MTITEFLEARIAEDEALANAATSGPWKWWNLEGADQGWSDNGPNLESTQGEWATCPYYCTWKDGDTSSRGESGKQGHQHLVTEPVIGSWGHDANGITVALADATHIAVHDPSRVLAECAAKRAIIAAHPIVDDVVEVSTRIKWGFACETCSSYGDIVEDNGYCDTLRALAAIYKDHPDYQQEWAL